MRTKYAILTPKSKKADQKLSYFGTKWFYRGMSSEIKFCAKGEHYKLMSLNGKKLLFVKQNDDPDFLISLI